MCYKIKSQTRSLSRPLSLTWPLSSTVSDVNYVTSFQLHGFHFFHVWGQNQTKSSLSSHHLNNASHNRRWAVITGKVSHPITNLAASAERSNSQTSWTVPSNPQSITVVGEAIGWKKGSKFNVSDWKVNIMTSSTLTYINDHLLDSFFSIHISFKVQKTSHTT